jgi:hypothetical protein
MAGNSGGLFGKRKGGPAPGKGLGPGSPQPPKRVLRLPRISEPVFWIVLIGCALCGLSDTATTMAAYLSFGIIILPVVMFILAPTVLVYALAAQAPRFALKNGLGWSGAAVAGVLALGFVQLPVVVGRMVLSAEAREAQASNFGAPPRLGAGSVIAVSVQQYNSGMTCETFCRQLLTSGAADTVLVPADKDADFASGFGTARAYSLGSPATCDPGEACLTMRQLPRARPDIVIDVRQPVRRASKQKEAFLDSRNPFWPGESSQRQLNVWTCTSTNSCTKVMQQTEVKQQRLALPLFYAVKGQGFGLKGLWARQEWSAGKIDLPALMIAMRPDVAPQLHGAPAGRSSGGSMETIPVGPDLDVSDIDARDGMAIAQTVKRLGDRDSRLSTREIAFVRDRAFKDDGEALYMAFDWIKHPEAASAMLDDLARAMKNPRSYHSAISLPVASLSKEDFARIAPDVAAYVKRRGDWTELGGAQPSFVIRLGEGGPTMGDAIASLIRPDSTDRVRHAGAVVVALCRLGTDGRASARELRRLQAAIANPENPRAIRSDGIWARQIPLAIRRVETGRPEKSACIRELLKEPKLNLDREWLDSLVEMDS